MTGVNSTASQTSRIVALTGAGTGIGRATARAFAAEGAHVVAIGRRAEPLMETAAESDRITALTADITAEGESSRILQAVQERHGRLDVLVNNAGIVFRPRLREGCADVSWGSPGAPSPGYCGRRPSGSGSNAVQILTAAAGAAMVPSGGS